jgi:hypothetical protein
MIEDQRRFGMDQRMTLFGRFFPTAIAIICLGFGLLVQACDGTRSKSESGKEMAMTHSIPKTAIPPIDAVAPARTEMATFAVG